VTKTAKYHQVLLDTGPLVAILTPNESEHHSCSETLAQIEPPLLTCWPVLTEAAWLLRRDIAAVRTLLATGRDGWFSILDLNSNDLREMERLLTDYEDLSPQLADVTLLHLAQRENLNTVFTLDKRDFTVFRFKGKKRLRLLPDENA